MILVVALGLFAGAAFADTPAPLPSNVCNGPVTFRGQTASILWEGMKTKTVKKKLTPDVTLLTKSYDADEGGDKVHVECERMIDSKGNEVGYSIGHKSGCWMSFKKIGKQTDGPSMEKQNNPPSTSSN